MAKKNMAKKNKTDIFVEQPELWFKEFVLKDNSTKMLRERAGIESEIPEYPYRAIKLINTNVSKATTWILNSYSTQPQPPLTWAFPRGFIKLFRENSHVPSTKLAYAKGQAKTEFVDFYEQQNSLSAKVTLKHEMCYDLGSSPVPGFVLFRDYELLKNQRQINLSDITYDRSDWNEGIHFLRYWFLTGSYGPKECFPGRWVLLGYRENTAEEGNITVNKIPEKIFEVKR